MAMANAVKATAEKPCGRSWIPEQMWKKIAFFKANILLKEKL